MTLVVHRCRFVDFTPAAVTALSFPPLRLPSVKGKKSTAHQQTLKFTTLAVGRANGNIELCEWTGTDSYYEAPQAWVVRKTLAGLYPSKVESLAFSIRFLDEVAEDEVPSILNLRLFSAGGSSELAEWDIEHSCVRRTIASQGGTIWAVSPNPASTLLALGCEDGSVRLLSIENDSLTHMRRFDRVKSRILSLAWGPPIPRQTAKKQKQDAMDTSDDDDDENDWKDSWLVTGCSDSSLRKWDLATGRVLDRMGTDKIRGERTLVWTVSVLGDGTIVSGDSMGMVKFWDPVTCTQMESFHGHAADVLCLTIGPEGTVVYTSGVDQKITQFSYIKISRSEMSSSPSAGSPSRWVQTSSRRMHSHDVRAIAIWPPYSPLPPPYRRQFPLDIAPVLASGGFDMSVVLTPAALPTSTVVKVVNPLATSTAATFGDSYHRRLAYSSGPCNSSAVHLARQARLLLCMRDAGLTVWRILPKRLSFEQQSDELDGDVPSGGWERVLDMELNVHTNLVASAISNDGRWIAISDWYESKLFHLEQEQSGDLKPRRIRDFSAIIQSHIGSSPASTGSSSLTFTPDSSKLVMATATSSYVVVVDIGNEESLPRVLRKFEHHRLRDNVVGNRVIRGRKGLQDAEPAESEDAGESSENEAATSKQVTATITRMAISPDGQWLVTTDDHCQTHVFNLDSIQYHCTLPSFPQPIHALAFDPSAPSLLVLGFANNTIQVYDVEARQFPRWAQALNGGLPQRFTHLHDPILGVSFDPGARVGEGGAYTPHRHALFWGATWLCRVKLDASAGWGGFEKKRRWDGKRHTTAQPSSNPTSRLDVSMEEGRGQQQQNFKIVTHYRSILFVDFMRPAELVVVERPLVDVLAKLPPPYFKAKYGTS
ncbi:WD40 repeat-like protein [Sparassis latifolia]